MSWIFNTQAGPGTNPWSWEWGSPESFAGLRSRPMDNPMTVPPPPGLTVMHPEVWEPVATAHDDNSTGWALRPVYGPHQVGRSSSCHNDEDSSRATPVFVDIRQLQQMLTRRRHPRLSPGRSNEPTEADSESKTETRREAESEPDPEAEAGAGMPVAQPVAEPVAEALPEEFPEPESVPARCDTCGATMFARSIRFAIPHQPINGKRPV